jgi:hypothetical protein
VSTWYLSFTHETIRCWHDCHDWTRESYHVNMFIYCISCKRDIIFMNTLTWYVVCKHDIIFMITLTWYVFQVDMICVLGWHELLFHVHKQCIMSWRLSCWHDESSCSTKEDFSDEVRVRERIHIRGCRWNERLKAKTHGSLSVSYTIIYKSVDYNG